jgi:diguanylate cyclase (GGDEF)-like protein
MRPDADATIEPPMPARAARREAARSTGTVRHRLRSLALLLACACTAAYAAADLDASIERIERLAEREPQRATRELEALAAGGVQLDAAAQLRLEVARIEIAGALDSTPATLAAIDRLLPRLTAANEPRLTARVLAVQARALGFANRGAEALAASQAAFEHAGAAGDTALRVAIVALRSGLLAARADFTGAYGALEAAERLAQQANSRRADADVAYYAAWIAGMVGDYPRAADMFERAAQAFRADADPSSTADALVGLALALIRSRRAHEALAPLDEAARLFAALGDARGVAVAEAPRAVALAALGRGAEAIAASDRALAILRPLASGEELLFALLHRAQAANALSRPQLALAALDEVRPHATSTENVLARLAYLRESAAALAAVGRYKDAYAALAELATRERDYNEQRLTRQLAAQRGQIESRQLARDNELLRREAEADRQAIAALARASKLQNVVIVLGAVIAVAAGAGLWWQRRLNRRIAVLAATDDLTGTLNRRRIGQIGQQAFDAFRSLGQPLAVALLDLDYFKAINDRHGHAIGDAVLRAVADTLARHLRATDRLGRYGGEEFVVILPRADEREAAAVVDRLRAAVEALRLDQHGVYAQLTLSAGVALANAADRSFDDLLDRADAALYRAKDSGRNRVQLAA